MSQQPYICVTIDRTESGWTSDFEGPDREVIVGAWPEEIVQKLVDLNFTFVSASYVERETSSGEVVGRHVVWMRSRYTLDLKSQRVSHV